MGYLPFLTEVIIFSGIVLGLILLLISRRKFYFYFLTIITNFATLLSEIFLLKNGIFGKLFFLNFSFETRGFSIVLFFMSIFSLLLFWNYSGKDFEKKEFPFFFLNSVLAMSLLIKSDNLFFSFLSLEYLSFTIYVMISLFKNTEFSSEAVMKYFVLGSFASLLMLFGIFLLYMDKGSLDYSFLKTEEITSFIILSIIFLFSGFAFKLAFVPFHLWTPDVFRGTPFPFVAFISTLPKIAIFGFLFSLYNYLNFGVLNIVVISLITMFLGNFSALLERNIKKIFAFSSIAHSGYILLVFLSHKKMVFDALIFYLITYSIMQMGVLFSFQQFEKEDISLDNFTPRISLFLFLSIALFLASLTGLPPLAGFYAKFYVFSIPFAEGYKFIVFFAFLNSVISAYYYFRIAVHAFNVERVPFPLKKNSGFVISVLLIFVIFLGIYPSCIKIFLK